MFKNPFKNSRVFKGRSPSPGQPGGRDGTGSKSGITQLNECTQPAALGDSVSGLIDGVEVSRFANTDGTEGVVEDMEVDKIDENDNYGIKILHNPSSAVVDIIFIHGLTGNAYSTWLHKSTHIHWPRDLTKDDIPDARVMTFGYDADVARLWGQVAQDGISGYARDLLGKLEGKRQNAVCGWWCSHLSLIPKYSLLLNLSLSVDNSNA